MPPDPYKKAGAYGNAWTRHTTAITSPPFSLANCPDPVLTFRHDYVLAQVGASQDVARVEISTTTTLAWTELASYTGGGVFGVGTQDVESSEWANVAWQDETLDLSPYTGPVQLRFSLTVNDDAASAKGWVFDNVKVEADKPDPVVENILYLPIIFQH